MAEDHPDLIEEAGGFHWEHANPMEIKSDNGLFLIETEDGVLEDALEGSQD
jgi:hypothetical protein